MKQITSNRPAQLSLSTDSSAQSPPAFHQDVTLHEMREVIEEHRYILVTDNDGRIIGVVPSQRILQRLEAANVHERMRWEGMPLGALISVGISSCPPKTGARIDDNLDCIVIAENDALVGISIQDDLFLSWQRLEPMLLAAACDPLTGLMNRLAYERRLNEEWARSKRTASSIAVVIVDLDQFKSINDRFGHPAGDEVLRMVASDLELSLRSYDVVARYGGDEFLALCLGGQPGEIDIPIQRIQQELARETFEFGNETMPVSVSLGAAVRHDDFDASSPMELFAAADECLYRSKRSSAEAHVVEFGAEIDETIRRIQPLSTALRLFPTPCSSGDPRTS